MTASNWIYRTEGFSPAEIALNGNRFMLGNGYMGLRGTLEEFGKEEQVGCLLNGVYDQVPGKWREPVNAPNGLFTVVEGLGGILEHEQVLDLRRARMSRKTKYENGFVESERFVSLVDVHLIVMTYKASAAPTTRIDTEVWDLNGPHFELREQTDETVVVQTGELGITVAVATATDWITDNAFHKYIAIYTSLDCDDPLSGAKACVQQAKARGYAAVGAEHDECWENIWQNCDVEIEGDEEAQFALRYSLYQLQLAAPRHSDRISIPARALSGQVYKGAVFWDTEMFMTPVFTLIDPGVARNLILYRYHTLDGAREKAKEYGYRGAFFAWEGQERGNDACTHFNVTDVFTNRPMRTYFRDKQIHISAAVVYAIQQYYTQTGDFSIFTDGAAEVVAECARFFSSYAYYKKDKGRVELLDVTGPDEYHERVANNAYTNRMVKSTLDTALEVLNLLGTVNPEAYAALNRKIQFEAELDGWREMSEELYIPGPDSESGLVEQFDGYYKLEDCSLAELKDRVLDPNEYFGGGNGLATTTRILKQADVVLMMNLFRDDYSKEVKAANWEFYEPRTEHGSSLSACAYAMVAAEIGKPDWAYDYFMKTATVDLTGKSKQFVGTLYIGGTHPAANGGAWLSVVYGFAGLRVDEQGLRLEPSLPSGWTRLSFPLVFRGEHYRIEITPDHHRIEKVSEAKATESCMREQGSPMSDLQAVIFDLDGVIVSTDEFHYRAWKQLADDEGIPFDREDNERLRGVSRMASLEIILEKSVRTYTDTEKEQLATRKNDIYRESLSALSPSDILPGVSAWLRELRTRGVKMAIGSSSKNAAPILAAIGLADAFDVVADGTHIRRSKPDPEVFLLAAEKLGIPPGNCLVVEDAEAGVDAAVNAGMPVLAVGSACTCPQATFTARDLSEIMLDEICTTPKGSL